MIVGVDLFCGLGGLTHGLIAGGIQVAAGYDLDSACQYPYQVNNRGAEFFHKDVASLRGADIKTAWGKNASYTLLAGCAPCQPFSTYSRKGRKHRSDAKWGLVEEFGRLITESRPDFISMENVPQLVDHDVFSRFLTSLEKYFVWWMVVDCAEYGVPQTRKRLVLLASRHGVISLNKPDRSKGAPPTVREAIAGLPKLEAGSTDSGDALHSACRLSELNRRRIIASRPGGSWRDWDASLLSTCHKRKSGETYPSVYGRMEWDSPSPTITTQCFGYGNGRFGHPEQHRAITLREAALLQTFPMSYKFLKPQERVRFQVLGRLIGNAVPVEIGRAVAVSLLDHIKTFKNKTKPQRFSQGHNAIFSR
jgi:DNA (cytosine-5)-methyltransferase 1